MMRFLALISILVTVGCAHNPTKSWKDPTYSGQIKCLGISYQLARPYDPRFWPRIDVAALEGQSVLPKVLERNGVRSCGVDMEAFRGIRNEATHVLTITSTRAFHQTRAAGVSMDHLDYVVDYVLIDRVTLQQVWTGTGEAALPNEKDAVALRLWVARTLTQPLNGLNEANLLKLPQGGPYFPEDLAGGRTSSMN